MLVFILGLVLFFGTHSIRMVAPALRDRQVAASERRWKGLYALTSLAGFVLIIWGYAMWRADAPQLYVPPEWGRHLTYPLVWAGLVLLAAAYAPTGRIKRRCSTRCCWARRCGALGTCWPMATPLACCCSAWR